MPDRSQQSGRDSVSFLPKGSQLNIEAHLLGGSGIIGVFVLSYSDESRESQRDSSVIHLLQSSISFQLLGSDQVDLPNHDQPCIQD